MPIVYDSGRPVPDNRVKCEVSGIYYDKRMIRKCYFPAVAKRYGQGKGYANVGYYQCKSCKYSYKPQYEGSLGCSYKTDKAGDANGV